MAEPLILLVDDEPSIRETVSFILEMEGYRVVTAGNGDEALEQIRRLQPPVVLLDAMMPRRDGFDVCRTVKSDPALAATKIVMLTALGQKTDQEKAMVAGADFYVTKPFDEEELLALLGRLTGAS
ncbi:MAG TPA: response regulator [Thermoanaerobaculaceae bacterium]|nr:response regulator [Thermoanaerobaculaceae bacterium]